MYRQGDVLLVRVEALPRKLDEIPRELRHEMELRYGPRAPRRLPSFFKKRC
jgi:hypothetical protein